MSENEEVELLSLSWNQDYTCFVAGTNFGFWIYNADPFKQTFKRNLKHGGLKIVEMLFRSNILALVSYGSNRQCLANKVMIWDDRLNRAIGEITFRTQVRGVKLRRDQLVIILEHKIYVYNLMDLKLLHEIETPANPRGICTLSHQMNASVLACPGLRQGQVRVEHFGLNMTKFIAAHDSHIACLALTLDGLILATASTKGTLIRIFNTMDGSRLQEVRRGTDRADIYSIAFSSSVQWLAVSSDKGTVHVFCLRVRVTDGMLDNNCSDELLSTEKGSSSGDPLFSTANNVNQISSLSFMKGVLPKYFSSEWSFAQFHFPEYTCFLVAFGAQNAVLLIGMDGSFYKCTFDPVNGGQMTQQEHIKFLRS